MRRRKLVALGAAVTVALSGCGSASPPVPITPASGATVTTTGTSITEPHHVRAAGTSLTLDGKPWWPIGLNAYQLGTDWRVNAGCGAQVDLDAYFGQLPPLSLTRFNVFASLAVDKHTGQLDFGPLDAVFDAAGRHDQLLVGVLTDDEGACENDHFKNHDWYAGGWRVDAPPGEPMPFAQWLQTAVSRWGSRPALIGWSAVGEPEPSDCGVAECDWQSRRCPADSATVLRRFIDDTSALIRQFDADALVWSGRAGGGQCGSAGDAWDQVAAAPGIDVLEYHDYDPEGDFPGDPFDGLQRRIEQARPVGKPLVITELGLRAGSCRTLEKRKDILQQAIAVQREHGTAGALFWSFVPDPRPAECTLDIGPHDPLMALLGG